MTPRDPVHIGSALHQAASPLLRQIRKHQAYKAFLAALPEELAGLCAPDEIRLAPRRQHGQLAAGQASSDGAKASTQAQTLFVLCANATVGAVLEQQAAALIEAVNAALPFAMVEALGAETASIQRIEKQLNILGLRPD